MKIKLKTKFNPGEQVVVSNAISDGRKYAGEICGIKLYVNQFGYVGLDCYKVHIHGHGVKEVGEDCLESVADFNKARKADCKTYNDYLRWLDKQTFIKEKEE